jgi:diguanylate cyclase (GGDEF)-like protein
VTLHERCLAIVAVTEIESLQDKILSEFASLCSAQSGALWVSGERVGMRLRAWKGMIDRQALPDLVDPSLVQNHAWLSGTSLLVPLLGPNAELVGLVQLSDPLSGAFADDQLERCEEFGAFCATALKTGARFAQLQRQGLRDRDTGAYTLSYFTDYATKEIYKARRYGRAFSLLTFSLEQLPAIRQRMGHAAVRQAQQIVLRVISQIIRDSDVVARATEQQFHVLLPETDYFGGLMFLRRALTSVLEEPDARALEARVSLGLTGGVATFPRDGDDFDELLVCCRRRMDERRGSLHHHLKLEPLPFWDEVELLLGNSKSPRLPDAPGEPSRRGKVAEAEFLRGRVLRRQGRADEAEACLAAAESLGWDREAVRRQRLLATAQTSGIKQVEEELTALVSMGADDDFAEECYEAMTRGLVASFRLDEAARCVRYWSDWQGHSRHPWLWQGLLEERLERPGLALDAYRTALARDPGSYEAAFNVSRMELETGRVDEAQRHYEECHARRPRRLLAC